MIEDYENRQDDFAGYDEGDWEYLMTYEYDLEFEDEGE